MAIKMAFFYRGHFSLRRMCLFLKNYTFSTAKRVIFRRRIMTGGYFSTSKNDPGHFSTWVIILLYTGMKQTIKNRNWLCGSGAEDLLILTCSLAISPRRMA